MAFFRAFIRGILSLLHGQRIDSDLRAEIKHYLEEATLAGIASGLSPADARAAARRELGSETTVRLQVRESGWEDFVVRFSADVRFAIRQLGKNPVFATTAIILLALGIGASTAIFAFVYAALIKPLPYVEPQQLVHVTESDAALPRVNLSYLDYADWRRVNTVFTSLDAFTPGWSLLLNTPEGAEPVAGERVTAGFFRTLGVAPILGRDFSLGEDRPGAPHVAMITYGAWRRRFGSRRDTVGQSVNLNGTAYTIVGVLPEDFTFALGRDAEFWAALQPDGDCDTARDCHNYFAVGRLKNGVTVQMARANIQSIARQLEAQYPKSNRGRGASVMLLSNRIVGDVRPVLLLLLGGAGLLLLIVCVNIASLLLVRSDTRRHEIGVRIALGASRMRIAFQFVAEGLLLAVIGASVGLGVAYGGMRTLTSLISKQMMANMPYLDGLGFNAHVFLFACSLVVVVWILLSGVPLLCLSSCDVRDDLSHGGRTSSGASWRRIGRRFVLIELAITVVLLTQAGLLGRSLYRLMHVDVGFTVDHLATLHVRLPSTDFSGDRQQAAFTGRMLDRVESLPGVQTAAVTSLLPVSCNCYTDWIRILGRPYKGDHLMANVRVVSSHFFATLGARIVAGRGFSDTDDLSKPKLMIINRAFARKYIPDENPLGKLVADPDLRSSSMKQIIGVVGNFKDASLDDEQEPAAYYPYEQQPRSDIYLMVRTSQNERSILPSLSAAIHQLNINVGLDQGSTMAEEIDESKSAYFHRASADLVGGFAILALLLSAVGLYGIVSYSVSQRTRELGVRIALGAQRSFVQRMILGEAAWLAAGGTAMGLFSSLAIGPCFKRLLFEVQIWDVPTLISVVIVLNIVAIVASYVPAFRASSVNPVEALRAE